MDSMQPAANDSVDALYQGHYQWLLGWLRRRLHCPHQAADVAQDTFIRLLTAGACVTPREPRAFLATIAKRLMIDHGRRQRLEQAYRDELQLCAAQMEQVPSPEQILQAIQILESIDRALAQMKPRVRQVFILRHLDGLPQQQIADLFGITVKTVQKDLVDALLACDLVMMGQA